MVIVLHLNCLIVTIGWCRSGRVGLGLGLGGEKTKRLSYASISAIYASLVTHERVIVRIDCCYFLALSAAVRDATTCQVQVNFVMCTQYLHYYSFVVAHTFL